MEYVSTEEIAKKWGVKQRQVQNMLADGRVAGAKKYGRLWMIPSDAEKPLDLRNSKIVPEEEKPSNDTLHDTEVVIDEETMKMCDEVGLAYLQGDFSKAMLIYQNIDDKIISEDNITSKIYLSSTVIGAAISLGKFTFFAEIEEFLKNVISETEDKRVATFAELVLSSVYLGALASSMAPEWLKNGDFTNVYEIVRVEATYQRAKYFQSIGDRVSMLSVAQTALAFCDTTKLKVYPGCYLKILCASAFYYSEKEEEAEKWLLENMQSCFEYGVITPFAEFIPILGGLIERLLEREYPQYYDAIVDLSEQTMSNWYKFHNYLTKKNITTILSKREYQMAMLASHGVPLKKIAERYNISIGRQKVIMHEIYGKLFITNRKELAKHLIFRSKT